MTGEEVTGTGRGRRSKVARLIDEYDLDGIGGELEREWTKDGADRKSLRDLADDFNTSLVAQALSDAGVQPLSGEVENYYHLLTSDEASTGNRTRARRRMERNGVDVDGLCEDFVSYQAIRTYLTSYRGASYEVSGTDRLERTRSTVQQLQSRLVTVAESKLVRLDEHDVIDVESPSILVDVRGVCEECGYQFSLDDISDATACNCD